MTPPTRPQDVWKAGGSAAPARGRADRRPWLGATLALGALAGAAAGLLFLLRPDPGPVFLAVPVTEYAHPDWPPNPWAAADARGLRDRLGGDRAQAFQAQEKARILREVDRAVAVGRGERRPVVVHVSALGAVGPDGAVHLLPGDARPDDPAGWLPLADLLRPLRAAPRLLLILDVRPQSVLPGGDVNEALDAELERLDRAGELPFFVLAASTPAAGANVVRPLRRTAFGLALGRAAGGAADGWNPSRSKDLRVSVGEFAAYVREVTHTLSVASGLPPQLPRLHGTGSEFSLCHVPPGGPPPPPAVTDPDPYPDWFHRVWTDRDGWVKDGLHRRAPGLVHQFTRTAARAEERWLAGHDPAAVEALYLPVLDELRRTGPTLRAPAPLVRSVARARPALTEDARAAAAAALRPAFDRIRAPAEKDDARPPAVAPSDATAAAILDFALGLEDPTVGQVTALAAVAAGLRYPELFPLDLVAGLDPWLVRRWPAGTTRKLLLAAGAAEEAVAVDGRSLPWVRAGVEEADGRRRAAVRVLCDPGSSDEALRNASVELGRVVRECQQVRDAADALAWARRGFEEARAELADLGVTYLHGPTPIPEEVAAARDRLAENLRRLEELLRPPAAPALPALGELGRVAGAVRADRDRLRGLVRLTPAPTPRDLEAALRWPGWTAAERDDLLARLDDTSRAAAERLLAAWPQEPSGREPAAPARARRVHREAGGHGPAARPHPELAEWREAETAFHRWLGSRYAGEAGFVRGLGSRTAGPRAVALDALGRDFGAWFP